MKKTISIITCLILFLIQIKYSWPINYSPKVVGIVTDSATGEPIQNVEIRGAWLEMRKTKNGIAGLPFAKIPVLTDQNGKYEIPSRISIHFLSPFNCIMIAVDHPLYKWEIYSIRKAGSKYGFGSGDRTISGRYQRENIDFNISLDSMEAKFINPTKILIDKIITKKIDKKEGEEQLCNLRREWEMYAYQTNSDYYRLLLKNNVNIKEELNKRNMIMANIATIYDEYYKTRHAIGIVNLTSDKTLRELSTGRKEY
jgi:hypothetical protein